MQVPVLAVSVLSVCACLACLAVLLRSPPMTLYVRPYWGIANRLRTIRVAYDLARALGMRLVLVEELDTFCSVRVSDLLDLPVDAVLRHRALVPPTVPKFTSNVDDDCSVQHPLDFFRSRAATSKALFIESCGLVVDGLPDSNSFYKNVRIKPPVAGVVTPLVGRLRTAVGVHVRQGTITDYRYGNFFGGWDQTADADPVACCASDTRGDPSVCPSSAPSLDGFVTAMRAYPANTLFFVASDRMGCIQRLHAEFPGRIMHLPAQVERELDTVRGMCDFVALAQCREILASGVSSFNHEAAKVRNVPRKTVFKGDGDDDDAR